jgi:hypothetical protein
VAKQWVPFNLNYKIRFKPEPAAFERYRKYYNGRVELRTDADGWASLQGWDFMGIFGANPLCDFNVEFEVRKSD